HETLVVRAAVTQQPRHVTETAEIDPSFAFVESRDPAHSCGSPRGARAAAEAVCPPPRPRRGTCRWRPLWRSSSTSEASGIAPPDPSLPRAGRGTTGGRPDMARGEHSGRPGTCRSPG